jgi:hypothetical protein
MSSSEDDDNDLFYDARDGSPGVACSAPASPVTAGHWAEGALVPIPSRGNDSPGGLGPAAAYLDRGRTLSALFGEAPGSQLPVFETGPDAAGSVALGRGDARAESPSPLMALGEKGEVLRAAGGSNISPPAVPLVKTLTDRSKYSQGESSHSNSIGAVGGSGTVKKGLWYNMRHMLTRKCSNGDLPAAAVKGAVKVSCPRKAETCRDNEFSGLRLVQVLPAHTGSCWAMLLSPDGRYLASAGQDTYVNIWLVVQSPSGRPRAGPEGGLKPHLGAAFAGSVHRIDESEEGEDEDSDGNKYDQSNHGKLCHTVTLSVNLHYYTSE